MSLPMEMRAVVFDRPGSFSVRSVPTPRPMPGHALVRVGASMVCATDRKILAGKFSGTKFPHVPGHEFSGEVVALGPDVRGPAPGTRVGIEVHVGCGTCDRCREGLYNLCQNYGKPETGHAHIGFTIAGGLAQYASVPVAALHELPAGITTDDGAWTDNLGVALWALERGRVAAGERVAVVGPGAIGLCAAQLARAIGARVTLFGRGERLARGARFADETSEDPAGRFGTYDAVVEFAGTADAAKDAIRLARRGGRVVLGGASCRAWTSRPSSAVTSTCSVLSRTRSASRHERCRISRAARSTSAASRPTTSRSSASPRHGIRSWSGATERSA